MELCIRGINIKIYIHDPYSNHKIYGAVYTQSESQDMWSCIYTMRITRYMELYIHDPNHKIYGAVYTGYKYQTMYSHWTSVLSSLLET